MKLAIMQPYFFPYIGYFHLISAVDKFIVHDDVNFIKQGWINRNRILIAGKPSYITVPVKDISDSRPIHAIEIVDPSQWRQKLLGRIQNTYYKAPYFVEVFNLVRVVLEQPFRYINELATASIFAVCRYLNINTQIQPNSIAYDNRMLKGAERVIDICIREGATVYVNASGGKLLYSHDQFAAKGIELKFVQSCLLPYNQLCSEFTPGLSIIDVMMFNAPEQIHTLLQAYELIA